MCDHNVTFRLGDQGWRVTLCSECDAELSQEVLVLDGGQEVWVNADEVILERICPDCGNEMHQDGACIVCELEEVDRDLRYALEYEIMIDLEG